MVFPWKILTENSFNGKQSKTPSTRFLLCLLEFLEKDSCTFLIFLESLMFHCQKFWKILMQWIIWKMEIFSLRFFPLNPLRDSENVRPKIIRSLSLFSRYLLGESPKETRQRIFLERKLFRQSSHRLKPFKGAHQPAFGRNNFYSIFYCRLQIEKYAWSSLRKEWSRLQML